MEVPDETLDELFKLIDNLILENEQLKSTYRIQNTLLNMKNQEIQLMGIFKDYYNK